MERFIVFLQIVKATSHNISNSASQYGSEDGSWCKLASMERFIYSISTNRKATSYHIKFSLKLWLWGWIMMQAHKYGKIHSIPTNCKATSRNISNSALNYGFEDGSTLLRSQYKILMLGIHRIGGWRNIIQIHNNIPHSVLRYFPHSVWMWEISENTMWNIVTPT